MDSLAGYSIPIGGLENGKHVFQFQVDDYFLAACSSPYPHAAVVAEIELDRRDHLCVLEVNMQGRVDCTCDRCTAQIALPIESTYRAILKEGEADNLNGEDEVLFIQPGQSHFSVSKLLYDIFLLAIPMQKIYSCAEEKTPPCDMDILNRLNQEADPQKENEPSIWDDLKNKIKIK